MIDQIERYERRSADGGRQPSVIPLRLWDKMKLKTVAPGFLKLILWDYRHLCLEKQFIGC